jgi:hypothetical protein
VKASLKTDKSGAEPVGGDAGGHTPISIDKKNRTERIKE